MNQRDDAIFKTAHLFAGAYDANICLLHTHVPADVQDRQSLAQSIRHSFDRVCAGDRDCAGKGVQTAMNVRVRVLDEELPKGICRAAHKEGADLVIVGRGHVQESFAQVWSHLYTIIRESPCPVLTV